LIASRVSIKERLLQPGTDVIDAGMVDNQGNAINCALSFQEKEIQFKTADEKVELLPLTVFHDKPGKELSIKCQDSSSTINRNRSYIGQNS
jgi:hypothetical protein